MATRVNTANPMPMKNYLFILLFFQSTLLFAQNPSKIDSLLALTQANISEKEKVDTYVKIAEEYLNSNPLYTTQYASQAMEMADKISYPAGKIDALYPLGRLNLPQGKYKEAKAIFQQMIQEADQYQYPIGKAKGYNGVGVVYSRQGNLTKALEAYFKAIEIYEKVGDKKGVASTYGNVGLIYKNQGNYEKGLDAYYTSLKTFEVLGDKKRIASIYINIAIIYVEQGNYTKALDNHFKSLKTFEALGDKKKIAIVYNNVGHTYRAQGNHAKALDNHFKSFKLLEELDDKRSMAYSYNNIGDIYLGQGNNDKALENYFNALKTFEKIGEKRGVSQSYENIGANYLASGKLDEALEYNFKSLKIKEELGDKKGIANNYYDIGATYLASNNLNKALEYQSKASEIAKTIGSKKLSAQASIMLGKIYQKQKQWGLAQVYLEEGLQEAQEVGLKEFISDAAEQLASVEKKLGNYPAAYDYHVLYKQMSDSLFNEEQTQKITRLELNYAFEQEKDSIQLANQTQQDLLEKDIENRKITQIATLVGLGLLAILLVVLFLFFRSKQRSNKLLTEKSQALEIANEEIRNTNEELKAANEEIQSQNAQLAQSHQNLQNQQEEITSQRDQLQESLQQLKQAQALLVQTEKMSSLGQLTAGIAHEINNPVNFINANINTLKENMEDIGRVLSPLEKLNEDNYPEKLQEIQALKEAHSFDMAVQELDVLLEGIGEGAQRTTSIIDSLRTFSRLDEDALKPFDIHKNLDVTLTLLQNRHRERIRVDKYYEASPQIEAYPGKLNQVFMNLLANAVEAIEGKGLITITTQDEGKDRVRISIQDTGVGVPEEVMQRVFEPFFTTKAIGQGVGLGLSIVYGIIEKHQGKVSFESQLGKGTEFSIILPISQT